MGDLDDGFDPSVRCVCGHAERDHVQTTGCRHCICIAFTAPRDCARCGHMRLKHLGPGDACNAMDTPGSRCTCPHFVDHPEHAQARRVQAARTVAADIVAAIAPSSTSSQPEQVNHPQHYGGADNVYEAIKVIAAWGLDFCLGNTVKYISRAGKKDPAKLVEDLEKAAWYLDWKIGSLLAPSPRRCGQPSCTANAYRLVDGQPRCQAHTPRVTRLK